ncbi:MAG: ORF6N domain-containing protein [Verrucomicrobiota bacterium]|jgi:ORF6N domain
MNKPEPVIISHEAIAPLVHWLRHEKIMLDSDLAELYGVPTMVLNQAVKRNADRFPADFMFQITEEKAEGLRCQTGILKGTPSVDSKIPTNSSQTVMSSVKHRGRRYLP